MGRPEAAKAPSWSIERAETLSFDALPGMGPFARVFTTVFALLLAIVPSVSAQGVEVRGSGGPTLVDAGYSLAGGLSYSPTSRLSLVFSYDQTHLASWTRTRDRSSSSFRGGTLFLGSVELQVTPLGRHRWGPYGLAGVAAGWSRPNVNARFPDPVTNEVRAVFAGGGVQIPLGPRAAIFADGRMLLGSEGLEGIVAVAPVRVGMAWRF